MDDFSPIFQDNFRLISNDMRNWMNTIIALMLYHSMSLNHSRLLGEDPNSSNLIRMLRLLICSASLGLTLHQLCLVAQLQLRRHEIFQEHMRQEELILREQREVTRARMAIVLIDLENYFKSAACKRANKYSFATKAAAYAGSHFGGHALHFLAVRLPTAAGHVCAPSAVAGVFVNIVQDTYLVLDNKKSVKKAALQNVAVLGLGAAALAFAPVGFVGLSLFVAAQGAYYGLEVVDI
jgi:hypothetical protein